MLTEWRKKNHQSMNILIVDDSNIILERLFQLLEEIPEVNGIVGVNDAFSGISKMEIEMPDLLILDINLPGMSGIDVLRSVRLMKKQQPTIIILTNNTIPGYKNECLNMGADYFLDKSREFMKIQEIIASTFKQV